MTCLKNLFRLATSVAALAGAACSAPASASHDLYLAASINSSSRVMGTGSGAQDGLYVRRADATEFTHLGSNLPLLITVAVDPRDSRRIYAAALSGVLRSRDAGKSWRIVTGWDETEPKSVVLDALHPDTVYAGLPDGFIISDDQGQTWRRAENGLPARGKYTQCVQVDRAKQGRVLIGCESGIYLTEDGARSWRRVFVATDTVNDIQQSPHDAAHWLAVSQSAGALESRDGGRTWKKLPGVPAEKALYNVAFHPRQPKFLAIASWSYGLWVSEDGGRSWSERNAGLPAPPRVWRTAFDPDTGELYAAVVEQALYSSADLGRNWRKVGLEGAIIRSFVFVARER